LAALDSNKRTQHEIGEFEPESKIKDSKKANYTDWRGNKVD
jgi:hypothetical protein